MLRTDLPIILLCLQKRNAPRNQPKLVFGACWVEISTLVFSAMMLKLSTRVFRCMLRGAIHSGFPVHVAWCYPLGFSGACCVVLPTLHSLYIVHKLQSDRRLPIKSIHRNVVSNSSSLEAFEENVWSPCKITSLSQLPSLRSQNIFW